MSKPTEEKTQYIDHREGEKAAFGEEVHLFLHCHLRGYDCEGKGQQMHAAYYDKYGAPVYAKETWMEGYFTIERTLAEHFNKCMNSHVGFPLVAGYGGGCHLYQPLHDETESGTQPWNWTGWIPLQAKWISAGEKKMFFHNNRFFLGLRGNEIQNNLWDYHPHDEEQVADEHEWIYDQISPVDAYRGGYWYKSLEEKAWGRYLHVMALKSHDTPAKRYNFIVHPLAYRSSLNALPDASVDGTQWSIMNIAFEEHFGVNSNWGESVKAMEIFNDFTYFYSWLPSGGYTTNNGRPNDDGNTGTIRIVWFDTYPLEYCEFLLENALTRGVYLQILSANDAFYTRDILPPNHENIDTKMMDELLTNHSTLMSDPKGKLVKRQVVNKTLQHLVFNHSTRNRVQNAERTDEMMAASTFLFSRPYELDTVFGYTSLIDTKREIKTKVFPNDKLFAEDLATGENMGIDYLNEGRFYAHTGVYDLFDYTSGLQQIPFVIEGQSDLSKPCYEIASAMNLKFTFAPLKKHHKNLIWRYSIEQKLGDKRETVHGYFKLSDILTTVLNLSTRYSKENIKWIRFTAFNSLNPMKRAWFSPIKGEAFGVPVQTVVLPELIHRIAKTTSIPGKQFTLVTESADAFTPTECENNGVNNLRFDFPKRDSEEAEKCLYAYFTQGNSSQADYFTKPESEIDEDVLEATKNSYEVQPPRILQNIQGYFPLSINYPTRLDLKNSWDSATIQNMYFYGIDSNTCQPIPLPTDSVASI